ncbi:hypothetical protein F5Y09DRAFT_99799 [Xylaria sp. FL1042]|nr:hypothetical protein F5Y09DRAFT_99799 [Xylaria sp. FL1042]
MAPTSKGVNPAPNYTVDMNRVQTHLEARLRIVRSFMPSRAPPQNTSSSLSTTSAKPTPSFSALASTSTSTSSARQRLQKHPDDEETLFAETRAQDPNAGLGFGAPSKRSAEREKDRSDQILRSRLLGRKRRGGETKDASGRLLRRDESSDDEEPGRSGLGRAKKRVRREESPAEEQVDRQGKDGDGGGRDISHSITRSELPESELEKIGATQSKDEILRNGQSGEEKEKEIIGDADMRDVQGVASPPEDSVPGDVGDASEQQRKKRRKKKKKKDKSKEAKGE